ncbi:glycoside hydrolase family 16 protein [Kordia sp. YSTF-M3]|uniref:Glycoside hydrolase family 16 protein n=1 Tax=Kordia aestuariivivens TaxID=2759037 RepID=A0ABR7QD07_9FLAO|nr:glycoside hydrolase family 16 protein [Kordia aestuariivivens]MBC8756408.1 glycoside hydrolase family 16 protein [Kordia aestuariivivens]
MKKIKYILTSLIGILLLTVSCQDDEATVGDLLTPTNLQVTAVIVGQDANNPNGDGSGVVNFSASADDTITYRFVYESNEKTDPAGAATFTFSNLGINTYTVTVIAFGTGGISTSTTITVDVLATYAPPAELLDKLVGNGSRSWRIKSEQQGHFGLGPVGGSVPTEWYGAGPEEKATVGMYDDRYVFNADGTFTFITDNTNDDPTTDTSGTVFGRVGQIDALGGSGGTVNGADLENLPFSDFDEAWALIAPGGVETITLTGNGFIGYYTGGSQTYEIFDRSVPNELILRTTDGNSEFDWWFIITSAEPAGNNFQTQYTNLVWQDEFDTDGAPDAANWTYDLGAGGWGNGELQTYTNSTDNAVVDGGFLKINAISTGGGNYTSARLKSEDLFEFTNGRVEVRAKLPASQGTWPAIWALGEDYQTNTWPGCGEIDIMEQKGQDKNTVLGTVHHPGVSPGGGDSATTSLPTSTTEFHNYTVEWTPTEIIFLVDDFVYHTVDNNATLPFNSDFFLILNVAMGGTLGGDIDPAFTQDTMEIDYVRVYQ